MVLPKYEIAVLAYSKGSRIRYKLNQSFTSIIHRRISCGGPLKISGGLALILFNTGDTIAASEPIRGGRKLVALN